MQGDEQIGATLETIPPELKLEIAAHLDPDVPLNLRWSEMAQREAQSHRATLASLSLVSRSWAAALAGRRWQVRRTLLLVSERHQCRIRLKHSCPADSAPPCCRP